MRGMQILPNHVSAPLWHLLILQPHHAVTPEQFLDLSAGFSASLYLIGNLLRHRQPAGAPFMAEARQTLDPVVLTQLVPQPDCVVVKQQHFGDRLTARSVVQQHQCVRAPGRRCSAEPSRANSVRSRCDSLSRNPGRIMVQAELPQRDWQGSWSITVLSTNACGPIMQRQSASSLGTSVRPAPNSAYARACKAYIWVL